MARKNGTSMAAPHVAGTVALMFEAAGRSMSVTDVRALLFASANAVNLTDDRSRINDLHRTGAGYLNILQAEKMARNWGKSNQSDDILRDEFHGWPCFI